MKSKILAGIVALQVLWVGATVIRQERTLQTGTLVHLECRPVDPRDLLRGDFVILSYDISLANLSLIEPASQRSLTLPVGRTVWAELSSDGTFHRLVRVHLNPAQPAEGNILLKGRTERTWSTNQIRIEYGLERYYVREGTGNPRGKLTADVMVPASGQGIIKQVYVDGVPFAEAMRDESR